MKRFLQTFSLLTIALVILASGVDSALGYLGRAPAENSFTWYNAQDEVIFACTGPSALMQKFSRPAPMTEPLLRHTRG